MNNPAVQVVNLSKQYQIGSIRDKDQSFRQAINGAARAPLRILSDLARGENPFRTPEENLIWALRDVSFEVEQGGVLGIIGRNGAGKSTLLKILTRITSPTGGYARIKGRVGSLLEVGTGFHAELTGRENTYMSGAILGMRRAEIDRKFDEIVEFSGIARFIDTPVKRYSSGMYLRLAFAVAAHLEPDVLLVDEVLAVGDAEFQQKCLGKMGRTAEEGRTVLFVSHNMNAVKFLCDDAIWLENGQIKLSGSAGDVIDTYLGSVRHQATQPDKFPVMNKEYGLGIESCQARLTPNPDKESVNLELDLAVRSEQYWRRIGIGFGLTTEAGVKVVWLGARLTNHLFDMQPGLNHFHLECPNINHHLAEGTYLVSLWLAMPRMKQLLAINGAAVIDVPGIDFYGTGMHVDASKDGLAILPMTIRPTEGVSD
jgi:lipopolysaccharide transport system ATP-binding protein